MDADIVVVGAGVAGLACARRLAVAGVSVTVLDKARGVGGRIATRRFDDLPVDFGVLFFHGDDPAFLAAVEDVPGVTQIPGWPRRVAGSGAPCQPEAFEPRQRRLAYAEGLTAFPKHLARGLDVRLRARVRVLEAAAREIRLITDQGETLRTRTAVLALPLEQTDALLEPLAGRQAVQSARALFGMLATLPSLTVIAGYDRSAPAPDWDVFYPEESPLLQLICHDSAKRADASSLAIVLQGRPLSSRRQFEAPAEEWQRALVEEAVRWLGPWAAHPAWTHLHRWRHARVDRGNELANPLCLDLGSGLRLGITGEVFAPGGGVQAAWLAGGRLARRLLEEE